MFPPEHDPQFVLAPHTVCVPHWNPRLEHVSGQVGPEGLHVRLACCIFASEQLTNLFLLLTIWNLVGISSMDESVPNDDGRLNVLLIVWLGLKVLLISVDDNNIELPYIFPLTLLK